MKLKNREFKMNPHLTEEERIIKRAPACISIGLYSNSWRPVNLILTSKRLLFCQPSFKVIVEVALDRVKDIWIVKRKFILGLKRKMICIVMEKGYQYFAVNNPERWRDDIMLARNFR
ncbi:MAG: hypothetical protein H3Z54_12230 [archaeon]|nr:hypothetical protein [archaeon]